MQLFIRVQDGATIGNPILEDNFREAFPDVDTNNLPPEFARFIRPEPPELKMWETREHQGYIFVDGAWTDAWVVKEMTQEEKNFIQKPVKEHWTNRLYASNFTAWVYSEETNSFEPPIPKPEETDGKIYRWSGVENNWKEAPPKPDFIKEYKFDFFAWQWIEVTQ